MSSKWEILCEIEGAEDMESAALAEALNDELMSDASSAYSAEDIDTLRGHEFLNWKDGKWRLWAEMFR